MSVPTKPGWWWHSKHGCVWVDTYRGGLGFETVGSDHRPNVIDDDGAWIGEVTPPECVAALEAEREKLRAVVLAVAEACDVAGRGVSVNHVGVFADLGRAVDSALGIDGETWAGSGRALRALVGAS